MDVAMSSRTQTTDVQVYTKLVPVPVSLTSTREEPQWFAF